MQKLDKDISVVLPAYNEEESVAACVSAAHSLLKELVRGGEIIIVNDGSTDRTGEISLGLAKRFDTVKVITKEKNEGYGAALRAGFKAAKFDLVFFSDADGQFDMAEITKLLKFIDDYDMVIGFRERRRDPLSRKFISFIYNLMIRSLFGLKVKDINCAFKLFKRRVVDDIVIRSDRCFVNAELLLKAGAKGISIREVSVRHFPRHCGRSKVGHREILRTMWEFRRSFSGRPIPLK